MGIPWYEIPTTSNPTQPARPQTACRSGRFCNQATAEGLKADHSPARIPAMKRPSAIVMASAASASRTAVRISFEPRSEEHTSELQSRENLVCRLLLEKKNKHKQRIAKYTRSQR